MSDVLGASACHPPHLHSCLANVLPMSEPFHRPENASPRLSSRAGEGQGRRDATLGTSPQSAVSAASSTFLSSSSPAAQSSDPLLIRRHHDAALQLPRPDSTFATHYLTDDSASTPRQHSRAVTPTLNGGDTRPLGDASFALEHLGPPTAVLSLPPGQAVEGRQSSTVRDSILSSAIKSLNLESAELTHLQRTEEGVGETQAQDVPERAAKEDDIRNKRELSKQQGQPPASSSHKSERLPTGPDAQDAEVTAAEEDMGHQHPAEGEQHYGGTLKEPGADISVPAEAEQQIEATITEPVPNTRSRKASHYLGLFRENTEQEDGKKARAKSKDSTKPSKPLGTGTSIPPIAERRPTSSLEAESHIPCTEVSSRSSIGMENAEEKISPLHLQRSDKKLPSTRKRETSRAHESIEWRAGESARGTVPLRLLEEIREHRFPSADDVNDHGNTAVDLAVSKPDMEIEGTENGSITRSLRRASFVPADGHEEDDDEFESDKERISAATYYPHRPRTSESSAYEQDDVGSPARRQSLHLRHHAGSIGPEDDTVSEKSSEAGAKRLASGVFDTSLHVNARRLQPPLDQEGAPSSSWNSAEVLSDTDYESWDEGARSERGGYDSGVTDAGDATPTATPTARKYLQQHSQPTPRGAVELKPYKHQVGGHTKVFRFSKQAICKQLNNRENVFYEVIERRHPELLRFLPKYVCLMGAI